MSIRMHHDRHYVSWTWGDQIIIQMSEEIEMYHDRQVWVLLEDTHSDSTGALVPVLVAVGALESTMLHLKDLYIT